MREASTTRGWRRSIMWSRRARKKSSVAASANITNLPETRAYGKLKWELAKGRNPPARLCSCGLGGLFRADYLAAVIDLFSRQVVGWSLQPHMQASLVKDALAMAWWRRRPAAGLIFHSDRGSQYCSG